ncbi:MAG: hypothetical protein MK088_05320 [Alteromonas sp.]|nr:hypothetical protein [Alteromonas sp.]
MTVDHVVPEYLVANKSLFDSAKSALGLPETFEINSFENWKPACSHCNRKKATLQFRPSLLMQAELEHLAEKAGKVRQICNEVLSSRKVSSALSTLERALESGEKFEGDTKERMLALLRFASDHAFVSREQPLQLTQSFRLEMTSVNDALKWGATHWSMAWREKNEPALVVLFRAEKGECVECGVIQRVFQPVGQEGGGDPICSGCLLALDWVPPVTLGDLTTHVTYSLS